MDERVWAAFIWIRMGTNFELMFHLFILIDMYMSYGWCFSLTRTVIFVTSL